MTSQLSGPDHLFCLQETARPRFVRGARLSAVRTFALMGALLWLSGCDQLGLDTPAKAAERKQAEARAIGSACRHAVRAIEDCYVLNPKADKSAVFAGWREMDEYMRENKLEGVAPVVPRGPDGKALPPPEPAESHAAEVKPASSKPAAKEAGKDASKSK